MKPYLIEVGTELETLDEVIILEDAVNAVASLSTSGIYNKEHASIATSAAKLLQLDSYDELIGITEGKGSPYADEAQYVMRLAEPDVYLAQFVLGAYVKGANDLAKQQAQGFIDDLEEALAESKSVIYARGH